MGPHWYVGLCLSYRDTSMGSIVVPGFVVKWQENFLFNGGEFWKMKLATSWKQVKRYGEDKENVRRTKTLPEKVTTMCEQSTF